MAILEAVGGQLYLAVLISRLVGLYSPDKPEDHGENVIAEVGGGG